MVNDQDHQGYSHELKFVFNRQYASMLIEWLRLRCQRDALFESGIISSIYFDTMDWQFLDEKINSDFLKTKVRIRWYENINGGQQGRHAFVEAKYKIGAKRRKVRLQTAVSGKWLSEVDLGDTVLMNIPQILWEAGVQVPSSLFPAIQISYKRFRFTDPVTRCRLCVDYDIHAPRANWRLLPKICPIELDQGVFELKGDITELPAALNQLTAFGCRKDSFSKYSSCYLKLSNMML